MKTVNVNRLLLVSASMALVLGCSLSVQDFAGKSCVVSADCPSPLSCVPTNGQGTLTCELIQEPVPDASEACAVQTDWCNDIKPLMFKYCVDCHGPDTTQSGRADFRLDFYTEAGPSKLPGAKDFAANIRRRFANDFGTSRAMPPPAYKNQPVEAERILVTCWSVGGAPKFLPGKPDCTDDGTYTPP